MCLDSVYDWEGNIGHLDKVITINYYYYHYLPLYCDSLSVLTRQN